MMYQLDILKALAEKLHRTVQRKNINSCPPQGSRKSWDSFRQTERTWLQLIWALLWNKCTNLIGALQKRSWNVISTGFFEQLMLICFNAILGTLANNCLCNKIKFIMTGKNKNGSEIDEPSELYRSLPLAGNATKSCKTANLYLSCLSEKQMVLKSMFYMHCIGPRLWQIMRRTLAERGMKGEILGSMDIHLAQLCLHRWREVHFPFCSA